MMTLCKKVKQQDVEALSYHKISVEKAATETMLQSECMENEKPHCDISSEKKFITSPADVDTHRKSQATGCRSSGQI